MVTEHLSRPLIAPEISFGILERISENMGNIGVRGLKKSTGPFLPTILKTGKTKSSVGIFPLTVDW